MARVHCSDEVWGQFKAASGTTPVSVALGDLVQRRVDRHRSKRLSKGTLEETELLVALDRARELQADLTLIVQRLELRGGGLPTRPASGARETPQQLFGGDEDPV